METVLLRFFFLSQAGSLTVRVRKDADEQLVLAHITDRLSDLVWPLTIQISR